MELTSRHLLFTFRLILSLSFLMCVLPAPTAQADQPVVHAVLFYAPSCGHCQKVIQEIFPPLLEKYADQLQILGIDITAPEGSAVYQATVEKFEIPRTRRGVPTLIIADAVLVGSTEIPARLPGLIEDYLALGGVDWPAIPDLENVLASFLPVPTVTPVPLTPTATSAPPTDTPVPTSTPTPIPSWMFWMNDPANPGPNLYTNFLKDPLANTLALVVLVGMLLTVILLLPAFWRPTTGPFLRWKVWLIPLLALAGLGIAAYLTYVETAQVSAICGPLGDCNAVQQSEYARLFDVPVSVWGLAGYGAILAVWALSQFKLGRLSNLFSLVLLGIALVGVLFSIYLTFLEPFVIGATCAWCLASAVLMTALFVLAVPRFQTD